MRYKATFTSRKEVNGTIPVMIRGDCFFCGNCVNCMCQIGAFIRKY